MRTVMEADLIQRKELLDPVALKQLERYNERRLSAFETRQTLMVLNVFSTLLADCLRIACTNSAAQEGMINVDVADDLRRLTQAGTVNPAKIAQGQEHIARARRRLIRNVNVELLTEVLLFDLREVIRCQ
jgi:DNA polymerase III gamma/tau subunit